MSNGRESEQGLTDAEKRANEIQAYLNMYDLAAPEEKRKMEDAASGRGPEYYPSADDLAAGHAVSAIEEFQTRGSAVEGVRGLLQAAQKPEGKGPRQALSVWAHMGKLLRRKK